MWGREDRDRRRDTGLPISARGFGIINRREGRQLRRRQDRGGPRPVIEFKGAPEGYVRIHENHHLLVEDPAFGSRQASMVSSNWSLRPRIWFEPGSPFPEGLPVIGFTGKDAAVSSRAFLPEQLSSPGRGFLLSAAFKDPAPREWGLAARDFFPGPPGLS